MDGQKVDGPNGLKVNDAFERTSICPLFHTIFIKLEIKSVKDSQKCY